MQERLCTVRKEAKLSQTEFADKLGLTKNFISLLENGNRVPSDRTISDICRIFHVREEWLRNGTGDMSMPKPEDDLEYINVLLEDQDDPMLEILRATLKTYLELDPENRKILSDFAADLSRKLKEGRE